MQTFEVKTYNKSGKKCIDTKYLDTLKSAIDSVGTNKTIICEFNECEKTGLISHSFGMYYKTFNNK